MNKFKFDLGADVQISVSGEKGKITARAQYLESINCYLIRYRASDGRAVESWWDESAIE